MTAELVLSQECVSHLGDIKKKRRLGTLHPEREKEVVLRLYEAQEYARHEVEALLVEIDKE